MGDKKWAKDQKGSDLATGQGLCVHHGQRLQQGGYLEHGGVHAQAGSVHECGRSEKKKRTFLLFVGVERAAKRTPGQLLVSFIGHAHPLVVGASERAPPRATHPAFVKTLGKKLRNTEASDT